MLLDDPRRIRLCAAPGCDSQIEILRSFCYSDWKRIPDQLQRRYKNTAQGSEARAAIIRECVAELQRQDEN